MMPDGLVFLLHSFPGIENPLKPFRFLAVASVEF